MSNVFIDDQVFTDIANAIRDRNGETTTYKPREMDDAIRDLHNIKVKKWERPSDWPDYSKVDLTNQEVIYLTYDCTDIDPKPISIRVYGAYSVVRGQLNNGVFTAASEPTNVVSAGIFREILPTNEGDYVVYKVTPQDGASITRFEFARWDDPDSSTYNCPWIQPCIERYCRIPNWIGTANRTNNQYTWSTRYLIADTVMDAAPTSLQNAYNDGGFILEKVDMSTCSFENITSLNGVFQNQYNFHELYFPHDLSNKCTNFSNLFYNNYELSFCDLDGWDTSGITNFSYMFYNCRLLVEIKGIESFDVSSATNLAGMFQECHNLERLDVSKWSTSSALINLSNCFQNLYNITELDVKGFNTENVTNFTSCFLGCEMIKELDITNWIISNKATNINGMFGYCRLLEELKRNKNWNTSNVTTFEGMFRECRHLKEIDLSDFDFSKATTIKLMFNHCNSLRKIKADIDIPLTTTRANFTDFATQCWNLSDISELDITNCIYMPGFSYNYALTELTIPSSVVNIYDNAFRNMEHLRCLFFTNHASIPTLSAATDITNGMNGHLMIIVPDSLFDTWVSTTNWNNALLRSNIIKQSDYNYYLNSSSTFTNIDLSQYTWSKCSGSNLSAANGVTYANTIMTAGGVGTMIATTAPITIPTNKTVYISINEGYQYKIFYFDSTEKHIQVTNKDNLRDWFFVSNSSVGSIGLVVSKIDGTNFDPADWADSGITVSYAS